jgi:hypothetical protein
MHLFKMRAAGDILMVSLSFQLPAIDGFGTGFLILIVIFLLSAFNVSFTAFRSRSPDLDDVAVEGAGAMFATAECLAGGQMDFAGVL